MGRDRSQVERVSELIETTFEPESLWWVASQPRIAASAASAGWRGFISGPDRTEERSTYRKGSNVETVTTDMSYSYTLGDCYLYIQCQSANKSWTSHIKQWPRFPLANDFKENVEFSSAVKVLGCIIAKTETSKHVKHTKTPKVCQTVLFYLNVLIYKRWAKGTLPSRSIYDFWNILTLRDIC